MSVRGEERGRVKKRGRQKGKRGIEKGKKGNERREKEGILEKREK